MFALLPHPSLGWAIIETQDGMHARQVAASLDEMIGERIVVLLNRHGLADVPFPEGFAAQLDDDGLLNRLAYGPLPATVEPPAPL